jgi:hypothetical protein
MKALALLPDIALRSPLKGWLVARCSDRGITLDVQSSKLACDNREFSKLVTSASNVIFWNCRVSKIKVGDRNALWLDNALISQRRGVSMDHGGLFAESNLSKLAPLPPVNWPAEWYARREFSWNAFNEGDPSGPILVCLQKEDDSSVKWGFASGQQINRTDAFIHAIKTHLPQHLPVLLRPHPRGSTFTADALPSNWSLNIGEKFSEVVRRCRAVVTINSTCAHESVLAGVPVATLGTGFFTGWGVTLECANDHSRLSAIESFRADPVTARSYVSNAMTRNFLPYSIKATDERHQATEFHSWLSSCK